MLDVVWPMWLEYLPPFAKWHILRSIAMSVVADQDWWLLTRHGRRCGAVSHQKATPPAPCSSATPAALPRPPSSPVAPPELRSRPKAAWPAGTEAQCANTKHLLLESRHLACAARPTFQPYRGQSCRPDPHHCQWQALFKLSFSLN